MSELPKYRVWDSKWERMYHHEENLISFHNGDWELQRLFPNGDEAESVDIDNKVVFLMEYIGYLDKCGKEIYEGDKVKYLDDKYTIVRAPWGFMMQKKGHSACSLFPNLHLLEVIGNIYQDELGIYKSKH